MMEDRDVLKALESVLETLEVQPSEDGNYLVKVTYKSGTPRPGDLSYIAAEIGELLHRRIGHLRSGKLYGKRRASTV
jgi:hypothetical protein